MMRGGGVRGWRGEVVASSFVCLVCFVKLEMKW